MLSRLQRDRQKGVLVESKDRAQMTATSAMSFIHVALLKNILDAGPQRTKYYVAVLTLILIALTLQILAGILSIAVANLKKHSDKHHKKVPKPVRRYECCGRRQSNEVSAGTEAGAAAAGADDAAAFDDDYAVFQSALLKSELKSAKAEVELSYLHAELTKLEAAMAATDDEGDMTRATVVRLRRRVEECEETRRATAMMHKENEILLSVVEEEIMKRVTFWQNLLNYILYIVFICNAFITGLGVGL